MKIKILTEGPYSNFASDPPARAVVRQVGEIIDAPEWYGQALVAAGLASTKEEVTEREETATPPTPRHTRGTTAQEAGQYKSARSKRTSHGGLA